MTNHPLQGLILEKLSKGGSVSHEVPPENRRKSDFKLSASKKSASEMTRRGNNSGVKVTLDFPQADGYCALDNQLLSRLFLNSIMIVIKK